MISPGAFPLFHSPFFLRLSLSLVLVHLGREGSERVSARLSLALAACHLHLQLAARGASRCTLRRRGQQQSPRRQALSTGSSWGRYTHNPHSHTHTRTHTGHTRGTLRTHTKSTLGGWRRQRRRRRRRGTRQKQKCADTNAMAKRWQLIWVTLSTAPQAAATVAAAAAVAIVNGRGGEGQVGEGLAFHCGHNWLPALSTSRTGSSRVVNPPKAQAPCCASSPCGRRDL